MPPDCDIKAIVGCCFQHMGNLPRVPHDLFGHAANIYAGAAKPAALDDKGAGAAISRALGAGESAAAAADNNQVVVKGHAGVPCPRWVRL